MVTLNIASRAKMKRKLFSHQVIEKLGYYIYLYINPNDHSIFYVGKGKDNRVFTHLNDQQESRKVQMLNELQAQGQTDSQIFGAWPGRRTDGITH